MPSSRSSRGLIVIAGVVVTDGMVYAASRAVPASRCVEQRQGFGLVWETENSERIG